MEGDAAKRFFILALSWKTRFAASPCNFISYVFRPARRYQGCPDTCCGIL
jgi:hypothetical protein